MIVGSRFDGDSLEVANYQHDVYGEALGIIFSRTRDFYVNHAYAIHLTDDITYYLNRINRFDHRPFQLIHDLMAGYYRFQNCLRVPLPFAELQKTPQSKTEWQEHWLDYLRQEMDRLLGYDCIFYLVYLFVLYHTDIGYKLEDRIALALTDHYFSESKFHFGKGVNLLGESYANFKKEIENEPEIYREDILKLIKENKELLDKRISN